ncbi:MAG: hypothetical protein K2G90_05225 [Muribaculaceae bacterium]|nr:hypothetical protein [Muribaculaceae bacterium]
MNKHIKYLIIGVIITLLFSPALYAAPKEKSINEEKSEFPIMGWLTFFHPKDFSSKNIRLLQEGGINISLGPGMNLENSLQIADSLDSTGMKYLVNCPQVRNPDLFQKSVSALMKHPSVIGYWIKDEPRIDQFQEWLDCKNRIQSVDSIHFCLINLLPIKYPGPYGGQEYETYLKKYINLFSPPFFSFDNYCIIETEGGPQVFDNYYENLEVAKKVQHDTSTPFRTFCLTSPHLSYPIPTYNYLNFEAFSSLAYGSQGIIYYTISHDPTRQTEFKTAPLDINGNKTPIWDAMKKINQEIQNLSNVFLGCKVIDVWHTGEKIPEGTSPLITLPDPLTQFKSQSEGVVLSQISNKGKRYFIIVNHDIHNSQNIKIKSKVKISRLTQNGNLKKGKSFKITIPPGGHTIFEINE